MPSGVCNFRGTAGGTRETTLSPARGSGGGGVPPCYVVPLSRGSCPLSEPGTDWTQNTCSLAFYPSFPESPAVPSARTAALLQASRVLWREAWGACAVWFGVRQHGARKTMFLLGPRARASSQASRTQGCRKAGEAHGSAPAGGTARAERGAA